MSLYFADFPSGSEGLYGSDSTLLFDGIYASKNGGVDLVDDPDPNVLGKCLRLSTGGDNYAGFLRLVGPSAQNKIGMAARWFSGGLPVTYGTGISMGFRDSSNNTVAAIRITPSGFLELVSPGGTVVDTTLGPVLTSNSWNHVEFMLDVATGGGTMTGTYEVRVNGITVLPNALTSISWTTAVGLPIAYVLIRQRGFESNVPLCYFKDVVYWNGSGSENNDFFGTVSVLDLTVDDDQALNWGTSFGPDGYKMIANPVYCTEVFYNIGTPIANGNQLTLGDVRYQFTSGSVDAGSPAGTTANPWLVALGTGQTDAIAALRNAINGTGTPGTDYSTALTANPIFQSDGLNVVGNRLSLTAQDGLQHSDQTLTRTGNLQIKNSILVMQITDLHYIYAGTPSPSPYEGTLTDLPPDVSSVRGLIPIFRAFKVDGGDAGVKIGVGKTAYDESGEKILTTAPTYRWYVSEVNPDTSNPWTPGEADDVKLKLDRSL